MNIFYIYYFIYTYVCVPDIQLYAKPGNDARQFCLLAGGIIGCHPLGLCSTCCRDHCSVSELGQATKIPVDSVLRVPGLYTKTYLSVKWV